MLDSELLADVYLELLGGREPGLILEKKFENNQKSLTKGAEPVSGERVMHEPRFFPISQDELEQHSEFVKKIKNNIWGIS